MFLLYRVLVYSAGRLIAAAAYQFLRYRGSVQNGRHLPNGKLAVFLPCRIAEKLAQRDVLPSELAQRYCAAASFLYAQTASDLFLRCRQAVPGFGVWQT